MKKKRFPKKTLALQKFWASLTPEERQWKIQGLNNRKPVNRVGLRYGRLIVLEAAGRNKSGQYLWKCVCDCGNEIVTTSSSLSIGWTKSCGCFQKERNREVHTTHGKTHTNEYAMLMRAKVRAKEYGLAFDIGIEDVVIPEKCPLLGVDLVVGSREENENSPSIDRIDNTKGYKKDNVWVISRRANSIKNNASLKELKNIVKALEERKTGI